MKKLLLASMMSVGSMCAGPALAADNCETIKAQIDAKIKNVGVAVYKLSVVGANETANGKVVGTCEAGKKKIVYWRGTN
jgi:hypothetical protein